MKKGWFIIGINLLLLTGFSAGAQLAGRNVPLEGLATCLHYDTAFVSGPVTIDDNANDEDILQTVKDDILYKGNVEFKIGFASVKCDEAVSNDTKKSLSAGHVTIACLCYPLLTGDHLTYNEVSLQAILTGHITEQEKGTEKKLGDIVKIDMSRDRYTITRLK